jgi:hypothetical protein
VFPSVCGLQALGRPILSNNFTTNPSSKKKPHGPLFKGLHKFLINSSKITLISCTKRYWQIHSSQQSHQIRLQQVQPSTLITSSPAHLILNLPWQKRLPTISEASDFSLTLPEAAERAERLHEQLAEIFPPNEDPVSRLGRTLSHRSVVSTTPSFALQQEEAALQASLQKFEFIDNGGCGEVFIYTGKLQVIKRAKHHDQQLWKDYCTGLDVHSKFAIAQDIFQPFEPPRIPKPKCCISPDNEKWWQANGSKFPDDRQTEETNSGRLDRRVLSA